MARSLSVAGFVALAIGLLWIGQGTGVVAWPRSSFMINQLQWAGYGAMLGAIGLILVATRPLAVMPRALTALLVVLVCADVGYIVYFNLKVCRGVV